MRREAAMAERDAERHGVEANARETASEAFRFYFEVLAAREQRRVLERLVATTTRVFEAARAAADRGATAGIDAEVADSARIAVLQRAATAARAEAACDRFARQSGRSDCHRNSLGSRARSSRSRAPNVFPGRKLA